MKAEKREQQNGFEQQKLTQAAEIPKNELHQARLRMAGAAHSEARKRNLDDIRKPVSASPKPLLMQDPLNFTKVFRLAAD